MAVEFDKYAARGAYHWFESNPLGLRYNAPLVSRYRSVLSRIPADAGSILDIGCGDGYLSYLIAKLLPKAEVWGVDSEQQGIEIADPMTRRMGVENLKFLHNDSDRLPFEDGYFAAIVMADVIEHLPDPEAVLAELHRVLDRNGILIVTTPNRQRDFVWDVRHEREYSGPELGAEIGAHFPRVSIYGSWPMRYVRAWRRKRAGRVMLDLASRFASNRFDNETRDPDESFGQLIAVARKN